MFNEQGKVEYCIGMFTDITKERQQKLHFKQLAEFDNLTNLPNRILLQQSFQSTLALAKRHNKPLAVLFIDLNDFKPINGTHGHAVGDEFCILLNEIDDLAIC